MIRNLVEKGVIVIAAGGGGIPVVREGKRLAGIEAVVDKDSTAALLADRLEAEQLVILTDVPCAYLHFRTPRQSAIGHLTCSEARALIGEGHFAAGSMLPKMEAAADFTCKPGRSASSAIHARSKGPSADNREQWSFPKADQRSLNSSPPQKKFARATKKAKHV